MCWKHRIMLEIVWKIEDEIQYIKLLWFIIFTWNKKNIPFLFSNRSQVNKQTNKKRKQAISGEEMRIYSIEWKNFANNEWLKQCVIEWITRLIYYIDRNVDEATNYFRVHTQFLEQYNRHGVSISTDMLLCSFIERKKKLYTNI